MSLILADMVETRNFTLGKRSSLFPASRILITAFALQRKSRWHSTVPTHSFRDSIVFRDRRKVSITPVRTRNTNTRHQRRGSRWLVFCRFALATLLERSVRCIECTSTVPLVTSGQGTAGTRSTLRLPLLLLKVVKYLYSKKSDFVCLFALVQISILFPRPSIHPSAQLPSLRR